MAFDIEVIKKFDDLLKNKAFIGFQTDLSELKTPVNAAVLGATKENPFVVSTSILTGSLTINSDSKLTWILILFLFIKPTKIDITSEINITFNNSFNILFILSPFLLYHFIEKKYK